MVWLHSIGPQAGDPGRAGVVARGQRQGKRTRPESGLEFPWAEVISFHSREAFC